MIISMMSKCFLLGSDDKQVDFLHWMLGQLETNIPILVANFGMSRQNIDLLENKFSDKIEIIYCINNAPYNLKEWYLKPYAILAAHDLGYSQVCWLDNDLEILSSIDDIFKHGVKGGLSLIADVPYMKLFNLSEKMWNSGVVLSYLGNDILYEWAMRSSLELERGDQEALSYIANKSSKIFNCIYSLPVVYNWLRLMGEPNHNTRIRHWTGPTGKSYIRENLLWK